MACAAPSRDNLGVQGPCGKPDYLPSLCLFHHELKNGLINVPTSGNLFPNPSVETDLSFWGASGGSVPVRSNAQTKFGSWSVRVPTAVNLAGMNLGNVSNAWPTVPLAEMIPILPNTAYTWSVWVRSDNGGAYSLNFFEHDAAGANVANTGTAVTCAAGVWTLVSWAAVTGATSRYTWALARNNSGLTDAFYMDGAQLVVGDDVMPPL